MTPLIQFQNVTKKFNAQAILEDVNLSLERGESVVLMGASGSGKSVLLRLLADLDQPDQGKIMLRSNSGEHDPPVTAMVFQQSALFDTLTVGQNLQFAWKRLGYNRQRQRSLQQHLKQLLNAVSLSPADLPKKPADLSGGMAKRVALARALIAQPQVLLYDEPTAGLDPVTAEQIARLIRRVHQLGNNTVTSFTVTHNYRTAAWIADRILYLDAKEHQLKELMSHAEVEEFCHHYTSPQSAMGASHSSGNDENRQQAVLALAEALEAKATELNIFERSLRPKMINQPNLLTRIITQALTGLSSLMVSIVGIRPPGDISNFFQRLVDFGLGSVPYIAGSGFLVGMALTILLAPLLADFGMMRKLSELLTTVLLQEIGPLLVALLLAGRFGAGIAAELGSMVVTEQLDALKTLKETPERYLLTPIIQAVLLLQPLLTLLFIGSALTGGYVYVTIGSLIRPRVYGYGILTAFNEVGLGIVVVKALVFGVIIALAGYQIGKTTGRSSGAVGRASRSAVVYASMFIIIADLILNQGFTFNISF